MKILVAVFCCPNHLQPCQTEERVMTVCLLFCQTPCSPSCLHPHKSIIPFIFPGISYHLFVLLCDPGETECERREQLRQKRAEIARCWIKYCLNLLQDTKKLLEVIFCLLEQALNSKVTKLKSTLLPMIMLNSNPRVSKIDYFCYG